jgi:galactokinase
VTVRAFAPGRVNLIGEHTDYNAGLCLPFAIAAGVTVTVDDRDDEFLTARALDLGEEDAFDVAEPQPATGWRAFVRGTAGELSSSAALGVALALALLAHAGEAEPDRRELARLCSRVENDWVRARTGLLDQLAALFGRAGHAVRLDLRSLAVAPVPLRLGGWRLVTVGSGVAHAHAASGYNERRAECEAACRLLGVGSLREIGSDEAARLPPPLDRRARYVLEENERVERAVAALGRADLAALGRLLDASHAGLRGLYEVSVPAVDDAVARLKDAGAAGARIVGGGFGGSVLALFPPGAAPPDGARDVTPGPGAHLLLETAMSGGIGLFEGARALRVPRTRFAPVKTTDDLLVLLVRRVRDGRGRARRAGGRRAVRRPRSSALRDDRRLRGALPARAAVAARMPAVRGPRRCDVRPRRCRARPRRAGLRARPRGRPHGARRAGPNGLKTGSITAPHASVHVCKVPANAESLEEPGSGGPTGRR